MTTIAPLLSVRNGARAVEFYKAAFGAVELFRVDSEDGAVVAQLAVNGAEFWVADARDELLFEIYRWTEGGYVSTRQPDGWLHSDVFGRDFLLTAGADILGQPWFALHHRP